MIRLANATQMPEIMDTSLPIRFLFVILGPPIADVNYYELGRSISTLMSNKVSNSYMYIVAKKI